MNGSEETVICAEDGSRAEAAALLSRKSGIPLAERPGEGLTVLFGADGVSLVGYGMRYQGDFLQMARRIEGGKLQHEMLVHVTKTKLPCPKAIDATAGMGEDSFLLAAAGYEVTMLERNPVIAALLRDAMERAEKDRFLGQIVGRMHLIEGDGVSYLQTHPGEAELIYLDPMFPARQKSGLIGKKLQLIQKLETPCDEEKLLLDAAFSARPKKIVIKRPLKGAPLAGKTPGYTVKGKAIRYDCFALPG